MVELYVMVELGRLIEQSDKTFYAVVRCIALVAHYLFVKEGERVDERLLCPLPILICEQHGYRQRNYAEHRDRTYRRCMPKEK